MSEVQRGSGPWRITYQDREPVMIEVWLGTGQKMAIGVRRFTAPCARCSTPIPCVTRENDEMDVCDDCYGRIVAEEGLE